MSNATWGDYFDNCLDEDYRKVNICGVEFYPSSILKEMDPIAYRVAFNDYMSNDWWQCEECNSKLYLDVTPEDECIQTCHDCLQKQL